jgi:4-aminobutyrate aminotransferase/(S)-3-amino-2-methylpropionate transaminase
VIEPVQGEGGFHMVPPELMRALRTLCDAHGILLIADEVQTGFARTGKLFAMEHYDVHADLITMAKSLAGGFPLSGVVGRADMMDKVDPGGLGGTYGGSPIGCAAALAVLDVIDSEGLIARANTLGERAKAKLREIQTRNDMAPIDDIRGPGSMIAFDLITERGGKLPDGAAAKRVTTRALEEGLILLSCGVSGETIRLLYPLTIEDDLFEQGLSKLEAALRV